jgi:large subunit ribosomal protein L6
MSRIGKQPIALPSGTTVTLEGDHYVVTGSKGTLTVPAFDGVAVDHADGALQLHCETIEANPKYGLLRSLLFGAVTGVSEGWTRILELHGVGMRAAVAGMF